MPGQTIFFNFAPILPVGYPWHKTSRAKVSLLQPSESTIPACPTKLLKSVWPRKRVLPQRTGREHKLNIIAPALTHLSTLQGLRGPHVGTFVSESGDNYSKQLYFIAKIA